MVQGSDTRSSRRSQTAQGGRPSEAGSIRRAARPAGCAADPTAGPSIESYRPRSVDPLIWAEVGPFARRWVELVPNGAGGSGVQRLKPLAQYLAWRSEGGRAVTDPGVVFRADEIEQFISGGCGHLAGGTRATYRSALRTIGEHVVGVEVACPDRMVELAKPAPLTPYTDSQFAALLGAIAGRPTAFQRDNAMVLVVFGRGAGLTAGDIANLTSWDVRTTQDGTTLVTVAGDRPRRVPLLRRWEAMASQIAADAEGGPMFNPARSRATRNDIARFCDRLAWRDAPRLSVSRLRITWVVEQLAAGIPLHVLAEAAGVTAPNLARYAEFLKPFSPSEATALLRHSAGSP